jgi:hypothetical protein
LELGALLARGDILVALDVDAFPLCSDWIQRLTAPITDGSAAVAGAHMQKEYAHPCCLAIRMETFLKRDHTFLASYDYGRSKRVPNLRTAWDVAESISILEQPRVALVEATERRGRGAVGTVFGDFVYHNAYATRHLAEFGDSAAVGEIDGDKIRLEDARTAWDTAVRELLPSDL